MKNGKKVEYIFSNNYVKDIDPDTFTSASTLFDYNDPIRYYSGNFWTLDENGNLKSAKDLNNNFLFKVEEIDESTLLLKSNKDKFSELKINNYGVLEPVFNKKSWELFSSNLLIATPNPYEDYYINFFEPIELQENNIEKNINFINKSFVYNFFSKKYESLTNDITLTETMLPLGLEILNNKNLIRDQYSKNVQLGLGGLISDDLIESVLSSKQPNDTLNEYYSTFSDVFKTPEGKIAIDSNSVDNFAIDVDLAKDDSIKKKSFIPFCFYTDIKFSNYCSEGEFIDKFLENTNLFKDIIKFSQNIIPDSSQKTFNKFSNYDSIVNVIDFDLKEWINYGIEGERNSGTADGVRVFNPDDRLYAHVEYTNVLQYIKNNIKNKKRSFSQFMTKPCFDEVLFYKIEKRKSSYDGEVIQNFWIRPDKSEYLRFIDTQIKYGKQYYYTVYAYTLVLGNRYRYEEYDYSNNELQRLKDIEDGVYRVKINNSASYRVLEIPFAQFYGEINEFPYTKPVVQIEKEQNNIKILLRDSSSESIDEMQIIENIDFDMYEKIKVSQENQYDGNIKFINNTNNIKELEIYKTTTKPINYLSFQAKRYKTILLQDGASFSDKIIPNIKYYYLFRYLNNHGVPSQASDVYEVEMKDEDGYMYLNLSKVDLDLKPQRMATKNLKRYMLVRPSIIQTHPNIKGKVNSIDDITLGPSKEPVWKKDFIIRITSKKSNRVLEFNIKSIINRKKD